MDADTGRITDVNPFLQDMLGYSHTELIGRALWEIGPVKEIAASQDAMRQLQKMEYVHSAIIDRKIDFLVQGDTIDYYRFGI